MEAPLKLTTVLSLTMLISLSTFLYSSTPSLWTPLVASKSGSATKALRTLAFFAVAWALTYWVLVNYTGSTVPVLDSFTNAMSFVGLWALARKYIEQWLFWIVVDVISCWLYVGKGIPFKAGLYGLYVVIAVMGYFKWRRMMIAAATHGDDNHNA